MKKVFGLICDNGDGSSSMRWFMDEDLVERLLEDDNLSESLYSNEGSPSAVLTFPDDLDLKSCGFHFDSLEDWYDE